MVIESDNDLVVKYFKRIMYDDNDLKNVLEKVIITHVYLEGLINNTIIHYFIKDGKEELFDKEVFNHPDRPVFFEEKRKILIRILNKELKEKYKDDLETIREINQLRNKLAHEYLDVVRTVPKEDDLKNQLSKYFLIKSKPIVTPLVNTIVFKDKEYKPNELDLYFEELTKKATSCIINISKDLNSPNIRTVNTQR